MDPYRTVHYRGQCDVADSHARTSENPLMVDCERCRQTDEYQAALHAAMEDHQAARARLRAAMSAAGFDPDTPVSAMTPERMQEFIAWRREGK